MRDTTARRDAIHQRCEDQGGRDKGRPRPASSKASDAINQCRDNGSGQRTRNSKAFIFRRQVIGQTLAPRTRNVHHRCWLEAQMQELLVDPLTGCGSWVVAVGVYAAIFPGGCQRVSKWPVCRAARRRRTPSAPDRVQLRIPACLHRAPTRVLHAPSTWSLPMGRPSAR